MGLVELPAWGHRTDIWGKSRPRQGPGGSHWRPSQAFV